jgi:hypothetical protein
LWNAKITASQTTFWRSWLSSGTDRSRKSIVFLLSTPASIAKKTWIKPLNYFQVMNTPIRPTQLLYLFVLWFVRYI